jgi:hypothetical protein
MVFALWPKSSLPPFTIEMWLFCRDSPVFRKKKWSVQHQRATTQGDTLGPTMPMVETLCFVAFQPSLADVQKEKEWWVQVPDMLAEI